MYRMTGFDVCAADRPSVHLWLSSAVSGHLPETSIETTSRWPRNRHESSGRTTVPADFVERLGDGAVDRDVEFWERVVSDIRNLRALMTA